jgi:hypothetical protein
MQSPDNPRCFAAAYEAKAQGLCERLQACLEEEGTCPERIEAALRELSNFATEDPLATKALFVEVHFAGGAALAMRRELMDRIAQTIEDVCDEPAFEGVSPLTTEFVIGVVEQAVVRTVTLETPEKLREIAPELATILSRLWARGPGSL